MAVTVRLFAAAREAAGAAQFEVAAGTVAELVAAVIAAGEGAGSDPGRLANVVSASSVLVDGVRLPSDSASAVPDGGVVDVLPPFAGG